MLKKSFGILIFYLYFVITIVSSWCQDRIKEFQSSYFLASQVKHEMGESMKKGVGCAKVKVLSKDCIFHVAVFYWFILHFSHSF